MPTNTYFNIDPLKQKRLIDIGAQLFSKNKYEDVDVQMVVKTALLPRGSFYAYFADMEDYYNLVISSLRVERISKVTELAKNYSGNLFDFLIILFKYDITQYENNERQLLLQHYFRFLQTNRLGSFEGTIYHPSQKLGIYLILASLKIIDNDLIKFNDSKKASIIDFAMSVYLSTYNLCLHNHMSEQESLDLFTERIRIIEKGIQ